MFQIPQQTWKQPNVSDKLGLLWATKAVNLDEAGYIKLSPRMVNIMDESISSNFGIPVAIGFFGAGDLQVATTSNANFFGDLDETQLSFSEDTGTSNPTCTSNSHAKFWQSRWHVSTATTVVYKGANDDSNDPWTSAITGLTSGVRHYMEVFASRKQFCVTNGNVVKQYDTSYANTVDLTIDSDYEVVGLAYNGGKMGVITAIAESAAAGIKEAKFYEWTGDITSATGYGVESDRCVAIVPYKSSFAVLTRAGQLKYFNGGGFDDLAQLPFFVEDKLWSGSSNLTGSTGDVMWVDGDAIYINLGLILNEFGREKYQYMTNVPSGVWCYTPDNSLYNRWLPSMSKATAVIVTSANVNTTSNELTITSGTVPATGSIARYMRTDGSEIGGLLEGYDYYVIKVSSTVFKLAETKDQAAAGDAIDITGTGGSNNNFYFYDLIDYGISMYETAGGLAAFQQTSLVSQDMLAGGRFDDTTLTGIDALCAPAPFLENRGWLILQKIFPNAEKATGQGITIKFRPLKENDKIIVKGRAINYLGLPISSPNTKSTSYLTWTGVKEAYTTSDLSAAVSALDAGHELELELLSGAGAGQMVKVMSITEDETTGVFSIQLEEEVLGAQGGRKSNFCIDNWKVLDTITNSKNDEGEVRVDPDLTGKFLQYKIELRGSETTIEDILPDNSEHY